MLTSEKRKERENEAARVTCNGRAELWLAGVSRPFALSLFFGFLIFFY